MSRRKRSAPGRSGPRARVLRGSGLQTKHSAADARYQRSAFNWLLDSATYLRDGDGESARLAARRALRALTRRLRRC